MNNEAAITDLYWWYKDHSDLLDRNSLLIDK